MSEALELRQDTPAPVGHGDATIRLRDAEARIEALLLELREVEARSRFDDGALAHFKAQLADRDETIRRQAADIAQLKAMLAARSRTKTAGPITGAVRALTGSLSAAKRK